MGPDSIKEGSLRGVQREAHMAQNSRDQYGLTKERPVWYKISWGSLRGMSKDRPVWSMIPGGSLRSVQREARLVQNSRRIPKGFPKRVPFGPRFQEDP